MIRSFGENRLFFVLGLAFVVNALLFQNCEQFEQSRSGHSSIGSSFRAENSNGNTYDGKIRIVAPSAASPGDQIEVNVMGGKGPYALEVNLPSENVKVQSPGNYLIHIPSNFKEAVIHLVAVDSDKERATAQIGVIGINRWFFEVPLDAQIDQDNNVYLLEAAKSKVLKLSPQGKLLTEWQVNDTGGVSGDPRFGFELTANKLYISRPNSILVYGLDGRLLDEIRDPRLNSGADCGGPGHLSAMQDQGLLVICRNKRRSFRILSRDEIRHFSDFEFEANASAQNSLGEIFFSERGGRLRVYSTLGEPIRTEIVPVLSDERQEGVWSSDLIFDQQDRLLYLNRMLRHLYLVDFKSDRPVKILATSGIEVGDLFHPESLDVDSSGNIFVTDSFNRRLTVFSSSGAYQHHFGASGSLTGQLKEPLEVQILANKDIAILEAGNGRISVFNKDRRFVEHINPLELDKTWARPQGMWFDEKTDSILVANRNLHSLDILSDSRLVRITKGDEAFHHPSDVRTGPDGEIFLSDFAHNKIQVFDSDGKFNFSFGGGGDALGQTKLPTSLHIEKSVLYVSELGNRRVQAFGLGGHPLGLIYKMPEGQSALNAPWGVAIDGQGLVYVADSGNHRIAIFSSDGKLKGTFGSFGAGEFEFNQPKGLTISGDKIYVSDSQNHRVQIFDLKDVLGRLKGP